MFLSMYYLVFKKHNHKDKVKNFDALLIESVRIYWDRLNAFVRGVQPDCINNKSSNEYIYWGQYNNNKAVHDTIVSGSYKECTYTEIEEKLEKISL